MFLEITIYNNNTVSGILVSGKGTIFSPKKVEISPLFTGNTALIDCLMFLLKGTKFKYKPLTYRFRIKP